MLKADLVKVMKDLMIEAKQNTTKEYQEGYSDGIFDFFNHLDKHITKPKN